ncbi:MAG TPA: hypothetical protein VIL30_17770 [Ramlibacter sp.]|jgi:chemotaxis protein histidine kinase CheA
MMMAPERQSLPTVSLVLEVGKRLDQLLAQRLPRLEQLRGDLHAHASDWNGAALERALLAHLAALAGLDLGLLVGAGLRAGPLERHEAAFRRQAATVADCTEVTWGAVKDFVEFSARETVAAEALVSDFVMEARAIQRQAGDARTTTAAVLADVHAREAGATGDASRRALAELALKAAALQQRVTAVEDLCATSHRVQSTTYQIRDERSALVGSLKTLAQALGGGLLDCLRPLVGPSHRAVAEDLERAGTQRHRLHLDLQDALVHLRRVQTSYSAVATALEAMGEKVRSCAVQAPSRNP